MKNLIVVLILSIGAITSIASSTWTDESTGIVWTYNIKDGKAVVAGTSFEYGVLEIPTRIAGLEVSEIGVGAFYGLWRITSAILPDGITVIGDEAFRFCSNLKSVTIPKSVLKVGGLAFGSCDKLQSVYITDLKAWCNIQGNSGISLHWDLYLNGEQLTDLIIPDGVTTISSYRFRGCSSIVSLKLPKAVAAVERSAFESCEKIENVSIENADIAIDVYAFFGDANIKYVTIPSCVTKVADTFQHSYLESLVRAEVCDGVSVLSNYLFGDCIALESVALPKSLSAIGERSFFNCQKLKSVTLPDDVLNIPTYAFSQCYELESIEYSDNITNIASYAFSSAYKLKSIVLPSSLKSIGRGAIPTDEALKTIYVDKGDTERIKQLLKNQWISIEGVTFVERSKAVVVPSDATGGVEIKVEGEWFGRYPSFTAVYGTDLASAVLKQNGKKDAQGNAMYVWQDYVAGTDPTDPNDVFRVESFNLVNGVPVIQLHPDLGAKRLYKTFGSNDLSTWKDAAGNEVNYKFFKVTVEMLP